MENNKKVKILVEGGIMIALASILSFIKIYNAPFGGSVTAGSMIPIIIFALRWGTFPGIFVGVVYGILQSILEPYVVHPFQFLLDYPVAFGSLGLAGLSRFITKKSIQSGVEYFVLGLGVLLSIAGRFISHLLSGVIFFKEYAGEMNPWIYSSLYNGGYLLIELLISLLIIIILWKPLKKINL